MGSQDLGSLMSEPLDFSRFPWAQGSVTAPQSNELQSLTDQLSPEGKRVIPKESLKNRGVTLEGVRAGVAEHPE